MNNTSKKPFLQIKDLYVEVDKKPILKGFNLTLQEGETHVLMGKNGQGKTTVAQVLAGAPEYKVTQGEILYQGSDLLACPPEERAAKGIFVSFQHPIAIPGVSVINFLKTAIESLRKARGQVAMPLSNLLALVKDKMHTLAIPPSFLSRSMNVGFSGGEKKRIELLQMEVLDPLLTILDEPDSGLDSDALHILGQKLHHMQAKKKSLLIITHYHGLLDHIKADYVHIIDQGRIARTGKAILATQLSKEGYDTLLASPKVYDKKN